MCRTNVDTQGRLCQKINQHSIKTEPETHTRGMVVQSSCVQTQFNTSACADTTGSTHSYPGKGKKQTKRPTTALGLSQTYKYNKLVSKTLIIILTRKGGDVNNGQYRKNIGKHTRGN